MTSIAKVLTSVSPCKEISRPTFKNDMKTYNITITAEENELLPIDSIEDYITEKLNQIPLRYELSTHETTPEYGGTDLQYDISTTP